MCLSDVQIATQNDATIQAVISSLEDGKWHVHVKSLNVNQAAFKSLKLVSDELSSTSSVLLRGCRIVMPAKLQNQAVRLAHEGHQGIVKTKSLIREKIWFPGIDTMVESMVKSCHACQVVTPRAKREPLQMSTLPTGPWKEISADFGQIHNGKYLFVITDDYSRFPIVEIISSTSANAVIPVMDKIFSEYGIPDKVRTDNGPPFNSSIFAEFATDLGFKHRKITPLWPRANAEVERFMKTVKSAINAARVERKCWKQEMFRFLRNYRATPHCSTGEPPATLLFGHSMKTKLPEIDVNQSQNMDVVNRDWLAKQKMKRNADSKQYVRPDTLDIGDLVLLKKDPSYKKQVPYNENPFTITDKKGSMVTTTDGSRTVTRNSSYYKALPNDLVVSHDLGEEMDSDMNNDFDSVMEPVVMDTPLQTPCKSPVRLSKPLTQTRTPHRDEPRRPKRNRRPPLKFKDYEHFKIARIKYY